MPYSPKCFSEADCLCAAKENIPVLKKWNSSTFLLHARSMCKAASSLMFLAGLLVAAVPGTVLSLSPIVWHSLILTKPLSVFSKDDFKKSILSSTRTTLLESPGIEKKNKKHHTEIHITELQWKCLQTLLQKNDIWRFSVFCKRISCSVIVNPLPLPPLRLRLSSSTSYSFQAKS